METSMTVVQQIKNRTLIWSSRPTSGYIPKRIKSRISNRHLPTYSQQYYSEQPRSGSNPEVQCPLMNKWINKTEKLHTHTHTHTRLTSLKKGRYPVTCYDTMNLEDKMLSQLRQSQKDKFSMIPLILGIRSSQIHNKQKVEWWLPGAGWETESYCLMGRVSVLQDGKSSGDQLPTDVNLT